jgi:hypothetical protein
MAQNITTRVQEAMAELIDQLEHAERLIDEQAGRIEALEAEIAVLTGSDDRRGARLANQTAWIGHAVCSASSWSPWRMVP